MNSDQTALNQKKIFEPDTVEELLRGWVLHAHKGRDRHDEAARQYDKYRYWLGVPAIALSAIVGTAVFASLAAQVDAATKILVGLVSIVSAVLVSLQTFFNFTDRAEAHRAAGVKYKAVVRELEQILSQPLAHLDNFDEHLDDLRQRLDTLELEAPVVAERIFNRVEAKYANVVFVEKAAQLYKSK